VDVCVNLYLTAFLDFWKVGNRCILAALSYALGKKAASKQIPARELFFEVVNVSQFCIFYGILADFSDHHVRTY
jgi:hypothetical protein